MKERATELIKTLLHELETKVEAGKIEVLEMDIENEPGIFEFGRHVPGDYFEIVLKCRHLPEVEDE